MDKFLSKSQKDPAKFQNGKQAQKSSLKRKYNEEFLNLGFTTCENDNSLPLCLVCSVKLSNESMVPSKLQRHFDTHPEFKTKPRSYFEKLRSNAIQQSKKFKSYCTINEKAQLVSYKIAQLLAKTKKPHTDAEKIIMPSLEIAVELMIGPEAVAKVKNIPLSAATIARRIQDMSSDVEDQIREHFNNATDEIEKSWTLQIDESTDISGKAQLIAFIRYVDREEITNQFFFCEDLKETTKGIDIFQLVHKNVESKGLCWKNCLSICADGAPAMQGRHKGFVAHVLKLNPNIKIVHCMIHREVLVTKCLPDSIGQTMSEVINVVNYIKSNSLRTRIFASLCDAMDSGHKCLLFHTEVRWLSKGKVLARVVFLRVEIISFFETEKVKFDFLRNEKWWLEVMFLNDLFDKLNNLNLCLQGAKENIVTITGKLKGFHEKLQIWINRASNSQFDFLPSVDSSPLKNKISKEILKTLSNLNLSFVKYFPSLNTEQYEWAINPFGNYDSTSLTMSEKENLIDLKNDIIHKTTFAEKEISSFWLSIKCEYPELTQKAIKLLLPFGSSYLCEQGFSALTEIKSKKRERLLMIDAEMRICLSTIKPRFNKILSNKQAHPSH